MNSEHRMVTGTQPSVDSRNFDGRALRQLYGSTIGTSLLVGLLAVINAAVYLDAVSMQFVTTWLGSIAIITLVRYWVWRDFIREEVFQESGWRWVLSYHVLGTALGLSFSLGIAWIILHADPSARLIGLVGVFGMCTAATLRITHVRNMLPVYLLALILPPTAALLVVDDAHSIPLIVTVGIYMIFLAVFAGEYRQLLKNYMAVGVRNQRLVRLLGDATTELERHTPVPAPQEVTKADDPEAGDSSLDAVIANLQDLLYRLSPDGRIVSVSSSIRHILNYEPEEIVGEPLSELLVDPDDMRRFSEALSAGQGRVSFFKQCVRDGHGQLRWLSVNAHRVYDDKGKLSFIEGTARDVTALIETERQLEQERERAETTLASIGDGVMTVDRLGLITYMNPAAEALTGWHPDQAVGERLRRVAVMLDRHTRRPLRDVVQECLKSRSRSNLAEDIVLVGAHGKESSIELQLTPLQQGEDSPTGVTLVMHDVTRVRDMASQLRYQAAHDGLTGLINRTTFEQLLEAALESAREEKVDHALMYIDLDQFKVINDTCGHVAGDGLLKQLALRLTSCIRDTDTLARLGGDEFGVLLERCQLERAGEVAEKLRQAVHSYRYVWKDKVFEVGASIGLVPLNADSGTISDVLSGADAACYVAKDRGRNRIHVFHPADEDVAERKGEMQWINVIQRAWDDNAFELHMQPILALDDGSTIATSAEFLLRLRKADGELVRPTVFLPAAERYHMMPQMDRWVLKRALAIISARPASLKQLELFCINLSGQSLSDETFLDFVIEQLDRSEVPPHLLCFEITETAVVANLARAMRFISILRGMGCKFSLDDFGSGLSSFRYLKDLPADFLKIDGSFIRRIAEDPLDHEMVSVINQIGRMMKIKTIAEYVENEQALDAVRKLGVNYAQGNFIGKPVPI